jgi:hypothetical protein
MSLASMVCNLVFLVLGASSAEYYWIPIVTIVYKALWTFTKYEPEISNSNNVVGAFFVVLILISLYGFIPYFFAQWLVSFS